MKRAVGLPGDKVVSKGKRLMINGEPVAVQAAGFYSDAELNYLRLPTFMEKLGERNHQMLIVPSQPPVALAQVRQFAPRENCEYNEDGFSRTAPDGHSFMMGDKRSQSRARRSSGFLADDHLERP